MAQPSLSRSARYTGLLVRLLLVLLVALPSVAAEDGSDGSGAAQSFDQQTREAKRLALAVLRQVKRLDENFRDASGEPIQSRKLTAQRQLVRVEAVLESFEGAVEESLVGANRETRKELKKLRRVVRKHYDRALSDFGPPRREQVPSSPLEEGRVFALTGEARAVLGYSGFKRPNANPQVDASAANFALGFQGQYKPAAKTNLLFGFDHDRKVDRSKQTNTRFQVKALQQVNQTLSFDGGLNLSHYSDKTLVLNSQSDFTLFANSHVQTRYQRLNAGISLNNHSYTNRVDEGYKDFTFKADGYTALGPGRIKARLQYLNRSQDVEALSHSEFNPAVVWEFVEGGSEAGAEYQSISHGDLTAAQQAQTGGTFTDIKRYKLHLHMASTSGRNTSRWGPELHIHKYPNNDERGFLDAKVFRRWSGRDSKIKTSSFDLVYRHYSGETQYDFLQLTYRKDTRPLGSGRYFKWNTALRAYLEQSDNDDTANFAIFAPAHTADFYIGFGWIKSGRGWLQRLSIGPIVAARFYIDTDRADAYDEDLTDVNYIFPNPRNYARTGLEISMSGVAAPNITWRARLRWALTFMYAADPSRTTNKIDLDSRISFPVGQDLMLDGTLRLHRTRAELDSFSDLNKNEIGAQLRYLFDLSR